MHGFWYDDVKLKYGEKAKVCYIDKDSFIVYTKTGYTYKDIAEDVETRINTLNYGKSRRVIGWNQKIITKFAGQRAKTYSYLIEDGSEDKKQKSQKSAPSEKTKFENYKSCLETTKLENKIKHLEKYKINIDNLKNIIKNS